MASYEERGALVSIEEHRGTKQLGETFVFYISADCPHCNNHYKKARVRSKKKTQPKSPSHQSSCSNKSDSGIGDVHERGTDFSVSELGHTCSWQRSGATAYSRDHHRTSAPVACGEALDQSANIHNKGAVSLDRKQVAELKKRGLILFRVRVTQSYTPNAYQPEMLTLTVGDHIDVISQHVSGMWTGILNGKTGTFKFTYVEKIGDDTDEDSTDSDTESYGANAGKGSIAKPTSALSGLRLSSDMILKAVLEKELDQSDDLMFESLHSNQKRPSWPTIPEHHSESESSNSQLVFGNNEILVFDARRPSDQLKEKQLSEKLVPDMKIYAVDDVYENASGKLTNSSESDDDETLVEPKLVVQNPGDLPPSSTRTPKPLSGFLIGTQLEFMTSTLVENGFKTVVDFRNIQEFAIDILGENPNTKGLLESLRDSLTDDDVYENYG